MTGVSVRFPSTTAFCNRCYNMPCRCFPPIDAAPLGWKCPECSRVNGIGTEQGHVITCGPLRGQTFVTYGAYEEPI